MLYFENTFLLIDSTYLQIGKWEKNITFRFRVGPNQKIKLLLHYPLVSHEKNKLQADSEVMV